MLEIERAEVALGDFSACFELVVSPGERVAILGESGSGKSTLIDLIAGFVSPASGAIRWKGELLNGIEPSARPVTTLFQDNNLFTHLSVERNLAIGIDPSGHTGGEAGRRIAAVLERVGLAGTGKRNPTTLSGGQCQRVALARCLLRDRPILLLDEPYSALDGGTRSDMLALTHELVDEQNTTLIFVTHDANDADVLGARRIDCRSGILHAV